MADPVFKTTLELPEAGPITDQEILEIIQDGASRKALLSALKRFNKYNLAIMTTTGALDLGQAQFFTVANTVAGQKTLTFNNAPTDRAMVVVVRVRGNAGNIVWPTGVVWNESTAPTLGATLTTVCLLWDGTSWTGQQSTTV